MKANTLNADAILKKIYKQRDQDDMENKHILHLVRSESKSCLANVAQFLRTFADGNFREYTFAVSTEPKSEKHR